jgi:hypothetical protein
MLISSIFSLIIGSLVLTYIVQKLFYAWFGKKSERQINLNFITRLFDFGAKKLLFQKTQNLRDARFAFSQNKLELCQAKTLQAFIFGNYSYFVSPDNLHKQHLNILDVLLSFSQAKGLHLNNVEKIEELIDQLAHTHALFLNESRNRKKIKNTPEWANKELSKKRSNLKKQLKELEQSIIAEVRLFFKELNINRQSDFTVH